VAGGGQSAGLIFKTVADPVPCIGEERNDTA
jgi:hypothetical protein